MSYCRFENTLSALRDCFESMDDDGLSEDEARCRTRLINLCADIVDDYGNVDDAPKGYYHGTN